MTSKLKRRSSIHKKTNPNELVVLKKLEKFERISLWSESHTSYELYSLSKNIIYELLLKFNWSMENFVILLYNIFEIINMGEIL
jgi:hypothetical protein